MKKTIKNGKIFFKIVNVLVRGEVLGDKLDNNGNVVEGFQAIKRCAEKDFNKQFAKFKKTYPNAVLQCGAHKIVTEFNEVLNDGLANKQVTTKIKQFIFDGNKWVEMIPNKEGKHVEVKDQVTGWTQWKGWIVAGAIAVIAVLTAYLTGALK